MEHENLIAPLHESLDTWFEKAKQTFNLSNWKKPKLDIVSLTGTKGGTATLQENKIRVNFGLYKQNQTSFLSQVIGHEISHLANYQLYGNMQDGHGAKWQSVMRRLGLVPDRCHNYDTTSVRNVSINFEYKCSGCSKTYTTTSKLHYIIQTSKHKNMICLYCNKPLIATGKTIRK